MQCVYISDNIMEKPSGAKQMGESYYEALVRICGKENVKTIALKTPEAKEDDRFFCINMKKDIRTILQGYTTIVNKQIRDAIIDACRKSEIDFVVFSSPFFGKIIKSLKKEKSDLPILVYYPNAENAALRKHLQKAQHKCRDLLRQLLVVYNEKLTNMYADKLLLLNERDENHLMKYYHGIDKKKICHIPIYFRDALTENGLKKIEKRGEIFKLLFVGGNYYPNTEGILWFVKNVLSRLPANIHLDIIGYEMDKALTNEVFEQERIKIYGWVENLEKYYLNSDLIIEPIFEGGGMKTKTAEALMFGKYFLATTEALMGYSEMEDYCCNTAEEFAKKIMYYYQHGIERYSSSQRQIYEERYSIDAGAKKIKKALESISH